MSARAWAVTFVAVAQQAVAADPGGADLATLNARIGSTYEAVVPASELVEQALASRLVLYGEVHDEPEALQHFLQLADAMRRRSASPPRLGIEFVDRGDWDVLARYLDRSLDETAFLARVAPTSLLVLPGVGPAHLELLRWARQRRADVLPLESRPGGARPMTLRNSEIRWNLARQLGRYATERLLVLYGVQHVLGADPVTDGLRIPMLTVTCYGDSVLETFARREGRWPEPGEVLRLRTGVYLQAVGGPPRPAAMPAWDPGGREPLLAAAESSYAGDWRGMPRLIEALDDPDVRWRRVAIHALRAAAERSFGYEPEADPAARLAAREHWLAWWRRVEPEAIGPR